MDHILEHLGAILAIVAVAILIILNLVRLAALKDKYVTKEEFKRLKDSSDVNRETHFSFLDAEEFNQHCRRCKEELGVSSVKLTKEIASVKDMIRDGDKKFTFIELVQLEMIEKMKLDISKERLKALKDIAYNRRT